MIYRSPEGSYPKGPVYTVAPMYLNRGYFKAKVKYLGTWTLRVSISLVVLVYIYTRAIYVVDKTLKAQP